MCLAATAPVAAGILHDNSRRKKIESAARKKRLVEGYQMRYGWFGLFAAFNVLVLTQGFSMWEIEGMAWSGIAAGQRARPLRCNMGGNPCSIEGVLDTFTLGLSSVSRRVRAEKW